MPFPLIIMWGYVYGIKIFRKNCCGLDVHKTWIYACIGLLTPTIVQNTKKLVYLPFQKNCRNCLIGLLNIPVLMFVWNHQVNTRFLALKSLRKPVGLLLLILNIPNLKRASFIPTSDIRHLRHLLRFRMKMTYQITGMKNRALNCLTVSNLKLDDVFSDMFCKSSRSIIQQFLEHPSESFDVTPYIHKLCKHPIEEIQAAMPYAPYRYLERTL